jgi:hypothetical protein
MDAFAIVPSINSHITHSMSSTVTEQGIQANIFIERPEEPDYETIQPYSVHLVIAEKGLMFKKFKTARKEAVVLALPVYIQLLDFFQTTWPAIKAEMEATFRNIRKRNIPCEVASTIHFYLSGTAYYEKWFGDTFLHFKKCSTDFTQGYFHLQRGGKSLLLNPEVMFALAQSKETLVQILYKSGYNDGTDLNAAQS